MIKRNAVAMCERVNVCWHVRVFMRGCVHACVAEAIHRMDVCVSASLSTIEILTLSSGERWFYTHMKEYQSCFFPCLTSKQLSWSITHQLTSTVELYYTKRNLQSIHQIILKHVAKVKRLFLLSYVKFLFLVVALLLNSHTHLSHSYLLRIEYFQ